MKTTTTWLIIGFLIITNIVLGMLYFTSSQSESASMEQPQPQTEADVAGIESEPSPILTEGVEAVELAPDRTRYEAEASSFSLDLDPKYQVIVEKDGGSGDMRSTILKIGRKNADEFGTVSLNADDYVKLEAYPSKFNGSRDEFVTNDTALQGNFADESSANVDGTQARRFTLEGVGKTIKYYFERDGITYFIESWDVSSGDTQVMLNEVVKGFSFN